jgi:trans-aconitate methyltransferase
MQRTPEPEELMTEPEQVAAYARADFADANTRFCTQLEARAGEALTGRALDLGCGPADIAVQLALRHQALHIDAVDGSEAMLSWAQRAVEQAGVGERVHLAQRVLGGAVSTARDYDLVISNSLLHHLFDPALLWREVAAALRPGAFVHVMDLMRPGSDAAARALVEQYSSDEPEVLKRDFLASLHAAFTLDEARAQLRAAKLGWLSVEAISDRHLLVSGRAPR